MGSLLLVSALILTIGLAATTRTENVTVGGYYPGIIVSPGSAGRQGQGWVCSRGVTVHTSPVESWRLWWYSRWAGWPQ